MYNKFIITLNGEIKFGNVFLHKDKDLLPQKEHMCHGEGLWKINNQRGCILLYGRSFEFGLPNFEFAKLMQRM